MSKGSTPNYTAAAQAQGAANNQAAELSTQLGRPNEITPWGSETWSTGGAGGPGSTSSGSTPAPDYGTSGGAYGLGGAADPTLAAMSGGAGGATNVANLTGGNYGTGSSPYDPNNNWTSTISLSPAEQQLLNQQNQLQTTEGQIGIGNLGQVQSAESTPLNPTQLATSVATPQATGQINTAGVGSVPQAGDFQGMQTQAYNQLMAEQNIQFGQQQQALNAQLANEGVSAGSQQYNVANQPLQQSEVNASNQAGIAANQIENQYYNQALQSNQTGFSESAAQSQLANQAAAQNFSTGLGAAQFTNQAGAQNLQQQIALQDQPLNQLSALQTGSQVTAPQFQTYGNTPVASAPIMQGALAQGQQNLSSSNNLLSGLFGLGSSALGAASDAGLLGG